MIQAEMQKEALDNEMCQIDQFLENIVVLDNEGKIKNINQEACDFLKVKSKSDLIGKSINEICKEFSIEKIKNKIPLRNCELIWLDKNEKEIFADTNITYWKDMNNSIKGFILASRDITNTKKLIGDLRKSREELETSYAKLQESKDELIQSEKLAFTGRIAASIAHEIRNPLTNAVMSVQRIKKTFTPQSDQIKHIDIITRNLDRINFLIGELLNCARPPKLNISRHNIHKILDGILEFNKDNIKSRKIKIIKKFDSKLLRVNVDKEQIERAFSNLIINAIEAASKGDKLTIITQGNKNHFLVKIQDTGKGISEEDIIRIFEPFFSSKPGGVGLGLAICYGIIVSHCGTIEVESTQGQGSTFTIVLPIVCRGVRGGGGVAHGNKVGY